MKRFLRVFSLIGALVKCQAEVIAKDGCVKVVGSDEQLKETNFLQFRIPRNYSIDQESFKKLENLENLIVGTTENTEIGTEWISWFPNLKHITFWDCILNIDETPFPESLEDVNLISIDIRYKSQEKFDRVFSHLNNLKGVIISNSQIEALPKSLFEITTLESLVMVHNELSAGLPDNLGKLKNLDSLVVIPTENCDIPESITQLTRLEKLCVARFNTIPKSFKNISKLKAIDLKNGNLKTMPNWFRNHRDHLEILSLYNNQLTAIPDFICTFRSLGKLDLSYNNLTKIPESFGNLKKLYYLDLSGNKLTSLPRSIKKLSSRLGCLNLKGNNILDVPVDGSLGKVELERIFGDRVLFGEAEKPFVNMSKTVVLRDLRKKRLCWNFDKLKTLKNKTLTENDLNSLVTTKIASDKENIFEKVVTQDSPKSDTYVLDCWRYYAKNDLGFDTDFVPSAFGCSRDDPFYGSVGNLLDAFFTVFTPEYMIEILTDAINDDNQAVCELLQLIYDDKSLTNHQKNEMVSGEFIDVSEKAVEYYLEKEGIIFVNGEN